MKSLRDYIDIIDESQTNQGLGSGLADAATSVQTRTEVVKAPPFTQQIAKAMQAGKVPRGKNYQAYVRAGWVTHVIVDGQTYDITDLIPEQGQRMIDLANQAKQAMER